MKQLYKVEGTFTDGSKYKNTVVAKNEQEAIEKARIEIEKFIKDRGFGSEWDYDFADWEK